MDLFSPSPSCLSPEPVKASHYAKTPEKGLKHHGAFVPACLSRQRVFTFLKPGCGYSCETWVVFQYWWAGLLAWG